MGKHAYLFAYLGLLVFGIGGMARTYMLVRVHGLGGFFMRQQGLTSSYKRLADTGAAPSWPVAASFILMPLGVMIVFGTIIIVAR